MALVLTATQKAALAISVVDAKGNPAQVDDVPVWGVSNESVLTLTVAEDGMSASVAAVGPVGASQVSVTCDADLGDGLKPIVGLLDVTVVAGEAVAVALTPGTPEEQTPTVPEDPTL
jgi:hypothetical protein